MRLCQRDASSSVRRLRSGTTGAQSRYPRVSASGSAFSSIRDAARQILVSRIKQAHIAQIGGVKILGNTRVSIVLPASATAFCHKRPGPGHSAQTRHCGGQFPNRCAPECCPRHAGLGSELARSTGHLAQLRRRVHGCIRDGNFVVGDGVNLFE